MEFNLQRTLEVINYHMSMVKEAQTTPFIASVFNMKGYTKFDIDLSL